MFKTLFKRNKKIVKTNEEIIIENFNNDFSSLLVCDNYLSKKQSVKFLKDKYNDNYTVLMREISGQLKKGDFKKRKKHNQNTLDFIKMYESIEEKINIHNQKYIEKHLLEEQKYLDDILKDVDPLINLDIDQRKVVLSDEDYTLVVAGAGAGKTTTIAAKVKYLVEKKEIEPSEILVISYTNKAVNELKERIQDQLKIPAIITTFHATGNAILYKKDEEKKRIVDSGVLFKVIERYLTKDILANPEMVDKLILFFGSYFDAPYEGDNLNDFFNKIAKSDFSTLKSNINEYAQDIIDKRSKKKVSIKHEVLRSFEEVEIANFLFLNGIDYKYEPIYKYNIKNSYKLYTPDFIIWQGDNVAYIEHFGITENGHNNLYSSEELERYQKSIKDKIEIHKKHNTKLIMTYSQYNDRRERMEHLKEKLIESNFILKKRDSKEVFDVLVKTDENKFIVKFTLLLTRFIQNFKVNGYVAEDFDLMSSKTDNVRTKLFLDIAKGAFLNYEFEMHNNKLIDFEDMINNSAKILREKLIAKEKLGFKYIIVDEYQDISKQRFDLTKELSELTDAKIIAVGDDWQSIYAFSGSNISLFTNFVDTVGYANQLQIVNTYRNAQEVIDVAGGFIQKNDKQIKKHLISPKTIEKPIIVISYIDDNEKMKVKGLKGVQIEKAKGIDYALSLINQTINKKDHKVLLIGRYNFDGERLGKTDLFDYDYKSGKMTSVNYPNINLEFLSAHSSKGLGYDDVIIINNSNETFGFPSQIEDDPILNLVIKNDRSIEYAEERRLFYVALTRTKNRVFLVTPETRPSEFVLEIIKDYDSVTLVGDLNIKDNKSKDKRCPVCGYPLQLRYHPSYGLKLYICTNEPEVCSFISNDLRGEQMQIGKCPSCVDGYLVVKHSKKTNNTFLGCTNYLANGKGCNHTVSKLVYGQNYQEKTPTRLYTSKINNEKTAHIKGENREDVNLSPSKINNEILKIEEVNNILASKLKSFRLALSKENNIPAFHIFTNRSLNDLVEKKPINIEELKLVYGFGPVKIANYGNEIIEIIKQNTI